MEWEMVKALNYYIFSITPLIVPSQSGIKPVRIQSKLATPEMSIHFNILPSGVVTGPTLEVNDVHTEFICLAQLIPTLVIDAMYVLEFNWFGTVDINHGGHWVCLKFNLFGTVDIQPLEVIEYYSSSVCLAQLMSWMSVRYQMDMCGHGTLENWEHTHVRWWSLKSDNFTVTVTIFIIVLQADQILCTKCLFIDNLEQEGWMTQWWDEDMMIGWSKKDLGKVFTGIRVNNWYTTCFWYKRLMIIGIFGDILWCEMRLKMQYNLVMPTLCKHCTAIIFWSRRGTGLVAQSSAHQLKVTILEPWSH